MSHGIYTLFLVGIVVTTTAKPHSGVDLSAVISKTLCPTVVKYDENDDRIPRVIKTVECEENPDDVCAAQRRPERCCRSRSSNVVFKCVQVTDTVLVSHRDLSQTYTIAVPVGCSCMGQEVTHAQDVD